MTTKQEQQHREYAVGGVIPLWFLVMTGTMYACYIWAEVEAWRCGYPFDPSGEAAANLFSEFYRHLNMEG